MPRILCDDLSRRAATSILKLKLELLNRSMNNVQDLVPSRPEEVPRELCQESYAMGMLAAQTKSPTLKQASPCILYPCRILATCKPFSIRVVVAACRPGPKCPSLCSKASNNKKRF